MTVVNQLETWLAQEQEIRAVMATGPGPGVAKLEQIAGKNGLELMQALLKGEMPFASIAKTLDFMMIEATAGHCIFQGTPGPAHLNPMGGIHGGWYATLLDSALGCAVHTMMPPGRGYTTAELGVNIVKAIPPKVTRVRAEGKVIHCGRQLATAEARLFGPDGTCTPMQQRRAWYLNYPTWRQNQTAKDGIAGLDRHRREFRGTISP